MSSELRTGLAITVALLVCCAGPIVLAVLGSGAVLGALSALWPDVRPPLVGIGALLVVIGIVALAERARIPQRGHPGASAARD
jgi:hypothetical protein